MLGELDKERDRRHFKHRSRRWGRRDHDPPGGVRAGWCSWCATNGPGVDPSFAKKVLNLCDHQALGPGLGLAISSDIVAAHEGRLWLESAKPGETEFRFWLPAGDVVRADATEGR